MDSKPARSGFEQKEMSSVVKRDSATVSVWVE
jgi:hypothetical protein